MCGVIGLLLRDRSLEPSLGALLVPMLTALDERGPDSSGVAVYRDPPTGWAGGPVADPAEDVVRLSLGSDAAVDWPALAAELQDWLGPAATIDPQPSGALAVVAADGVGPTAAHLAERYPSVRVIGTGRHLTVVKDTGSPTETCRRYAMAGWSGHLAVAHTRMATESAVTLLHAHPFVPAPDLCVVHNGSFSNHASVRRALQARGVRFDSDNDSEVAARLLAERIGLGDDLAEATRWVMKELDGFFTLVISTAAAMSVVRDAFACKPAVVAECPRYVAVASEYRALAHLPDVADARIFEPRPEEVYTWSR